MEELNEICDFCWDEDQKEVPAVELLSGVPLCSRHLNPQQTRFKDRRAPDDEIDAMAIPPKPEPKLKRDEIVVPPKYVVFDRSKGNMDKNREAPKSAELFKLGATETEFATGLGSLMRDVIEGRVDVDVADAACKVADKIIRVMELRMKMQQREVR